MRATAIEMELSHGFCRALWLQAAVALLAACAQASPNDALNEASHSCDLKGVKAALVQKADLNPELSGELDYSPLMRASGSGCVEVVKYMLSVGANPNAENSAGYTSLIAASSDGYSGVVKALIGAGANVNRVTVGGYTALGWAARYGQPETAKVLVDAGADVNIVGEGGTPLAETILTAQHQATGHLGSQFGTPEGHAAVATLLRQHGGHQ